MFDLNSLTPIQKERCLRTISSNAFYMLVGDALDRRKSLSVVRMGDGEQFLYNNSLTGDPEGEIDDPTILQRGWVEPLGLGGINKEILKACLVKAANECDYFAPSVSGIQNPNFDCYDIPTVPKTYVDNFFVNVWTEEMKIGLFKKAGHVLFIHRNLSTADAMQIRAVFALGVKVTYLKLDTWRSADSTIVRANTIDAPLVLFSGGPAGKYIGPEIAKEGRIPKVVLDLGNAADHWTLLSLKEQADKIRFAK